MSFAAVGFASRGTSSHNDNNDSNGSYLVKTYPKDEYVSLHSKELYDEYVRLTTACFDNDKDTASRILSSGNAIYLNYNLCDGNGNTAFICACFNGMINIINKFINISKIINNDSEFEYSRFNVNIQNNKKQNALMFICYRGLSEPLKNIISCSNLKINLQSENGTTGIMFACVSNNEECIRTLLLFNGINIKLKQTVNDKKDMFDYINPDTLVTLKDLIIPLAKKQYYNFYNNKLNNYYKFGWLNKHTTIVHEMNKFKNYIKINDDEPSNILKKLLPNLNNKIKLKKNNLIVRANSIKFKEYLIPPQNLKTQYSKSKQNLINKINETLIKQSNISDSNSNKIDMIRFIYNIALKHSIKDIKTKIEKEHKKIVQDLIPWF